MSFDLYFCRQDNTAPSLTELKNYFSAQPNFNVEDTADGGTQFLYKNEVTGVYCIFASSPLDARELDGCGSSGLSFNINYNRASFFAYEAMPLVETFCRHYDLVVEDPQEETVGPANAAALIDSWRRHNASATAALAQSDLDLHYLPERSATTWWRYMTVQPALEQSLTEDFFVPTPFIIMTPEGELFTAMVLPNAIAQFFPTSDYVVVQRQKKRLFNTTEEMGLVRYETVMESIRHLLDDYDFEGNRFKLLRAEKKQQAASVIQKLRFEPLELKQCTRIAPDGFHDVEAIGQQ